MNYPSFPANENSSRRAVAIVGLGAILPDALTVEQFWGNLLHQCYSITEVPPERWDPNLYYDPDPTAPDKTYSKIGGWVRGFTFDWKEMRIPPRVAAAMDESQKWALAITAQALQDFGYPARPLDLERTAAIFGTAMGGEMHYLTTQRISFPEFARELEATQEFSQLPPELRQTILKNWRTRVEKFLPPVTEDSMPGELANIVSGRVANVFNLRGPNFITDAACASSLAAFQSAVELLVSRQVDTVLTGGVDHNMGASSFIKFCKIGALSATGSRPFGKGADGFVMGEGAAAFLLKRLEDAERDGDKIYAVVRGIGSASDGKGKGIYAPNPAGQQLAIQRAWQNAGLNPASAGLVEAHGTSTRVGDVVEVESLASVFCDATHKSIALGSVKSNIGHLKAAAGAAGLLKAALALHHKVLPPTLNAQIPNPDIDFDHTPFSVVHEARPWENFGPKDTPRRCGVSAYGFGGTNFHTVLEEYVPGALESEKRLYSTAVSGQRSAVSSQSPAASDQQFEARDHQPTVKAQQPAASEQPSLASRPEARASSSPLPLRGILALGAETPGELIEKVEAAQRRVQGGWFPPIELPSQDLLGAAERLVIDFSNAEELAERLSKAQKAAALDSAPAWKALQAQGIFRGSGPPPGEIAFLFPGQGSQYLNMGRELKALQPVVAEILREGDRVMEPILPKPLSSYIYVPGDDPNTIRQAELALMQTEITQPAMLAMDIALCRLLGEYGFHPDRVMGHSLGEYAALIAAQVLPFDEALEAVAARGREMAAFHEGIEDNGWMAAVMAPYDIIQKTLASIDGYVVTANINSYNQCVIGGASQAVEQAIQAFQSQGFEARRIPVSHAFHTRIVSPASKPLRKVLDRLHVSSPRLPVVANLTGDFYPRSPDAIKDILEQQVASPVQWIKGLETLYAAGVRTFVEVGPKKALKGLVDDVLGSQPGVISLFTNHPKVGELASFNQALCGLYAAGYGVELSNQGDDQHEVVDMFPSNGKIKNDQPDSSPSISVEEVGRLLAQAMSQAAKPQDLPYDRNEVPLGSIVITGTGLGLPGAEKKIMDPDNAYHVLRGEQFIDLIPERFRQKMIDKIITRVVKAEDGSGRFEVIQDPEEVIRLAGRPGQFDLEEEYGIPQKLVEALDMTTQLAMAAGLDALREAGIPLRMAYRQATTGKQIPDRWMLPESLRDDTGVIFASAFPGGDRMADEFARYYRWQNRLDQIRMLEDLRLRTRDETTIAEILSRIHVLRQELEREPYEFDRRFLFRILSMGHSQFAEYIGARGPNTQVNAACASTAQALGLAEDWIRTGRCRRVIVIAADIATSDHLIEWIGAGFLATGAAATDDNIEEAALPFDRRRHGMIMGMGACALVVESEDALRERGMRGIVELLSSEAGNSAFHATRLDVDHISQVMDRLLIDAERRFGLNRTIMAPNLVFVSHETYTPARGGSASAEIYALRHAFGPAADEIVITNTKGFTGHAMGAGVEDVIAVKILEYGLVPPVPNHREPDPDLGQLNLSRGGRYPVLYALHLAAGFGSQISMTLLRRIPGSLDRVDNPPLYKRWLSEVSGYDWPETEVVKHVLRIKDQGAPSRPPAPNLWQVGTGPRVRVATYGTTGHRETTADRRQTIPEKTTDDQRPPTDDGFRQTAVNSSPAAVRKETTDDGRQQTPATSPQTVLAEQPTAGDKPLSTTSGPPPAVSPETDSDGRKASGESGRTVEKTTAGRPTDDRRPATTGETNADGRQPTAVSSPIPAESGEPSTVSGPPSDPITPRVLEIVSEKTGYPQDMLELDLDLEADLGVDTVKQAETFLALREAFDIPRQENLKLRDYPTLAHVIEFVRKMKPELTTDDGRRTTAGETTSDKRPATAESVQLSAVGGQATDAGTQPLIVFKQFEEYPEFPRRVPVPCLRPLLELCKPTGASLADKARVIVRMDQGKVGKVLLRKLEQRGVKALVLPHTLVEEDLEEQVKAWLEQGPIRGVYWLSALDVEPPLEDVKPEEWRTLTRKRIHDLYRTMRALYDSVSEPGSFLVTATRLGGLHGYGPLDNGEPPSKVAPLGGAVTGFSKAYKRERPGAVVKAVDFELKTEPAWTADTLIAETLNDPGAIEIGRWQSDRYAVTLIEQPIQEENAGLRMDRDTVYLITGAAGGVTSAIVTELAARGGDFHLLDLFAPPSGEQPLIQTFRTGREALKQKLIEEAKKSGERLTPARVEKQIQAVERQEAALRAVEAIEAAGGRAYYHAVDLRDSPAVAKIVEEIRDRHGRIDVLIHAAGIEASHSLPEKDLAQFDLVFGVKADGFFNLLHAAKDLPIGAAVMFSSVAGRFGNAGQTDYSAANDLLCKMISSMSRWRPGTRGIAIDWTAWGEIGMATRGSIPTIMEHAGIEMLPTRVGISALFRELAGGGRGEVVVAGKLGILIDEWDETGGLDVEKMTAWLAAHTPPLVMIQKVKTAGLFGGLEVETTLDPHEQPFLHDHAMDGIPLLPGVMGTEAFAELASILAPGYCVAGVESENFLKAFKFFQMEPQTLHLQAMILPFRRGELVAHTSLLSRRALAGKGGEIQEKVHFTARVRLLRSPTRQPTSYVTLPPEHWAEVTGRDIYRIYFHGPAYQVLECVYLSEDQAVGMMTHPLPADTDPKGASSLVTPRLIELCLQTAGVLEMKTKGVLALPASIDRVTLYNQAGVPSEDSPGRIFAIVQAVDHGASFNAQVIDESGAVYVELEGYHTQPLPMTVELEKV